MRGVAYTDPTATITFSRTRGRTCTKSMLYLSVEAMGEMHFPKRLLLEWEPKSRCILLRVDDSGRPISDNHGAGIICVTTFLKAAGVRAAPGPLAEFIRLDGKRWAVGPVEEAG